MLEVGVEELEDAWVRRTLSHKLDLLEVCRMRAEIEGANV
jgi:hypothetical protein